MKKFMLIQVILLLLFLGILMILPSDMETQFEHFEQWYLEVLQKPETKQIVEYFIIFFVIVLVGTKIYKIKNKDEK